MEYKYRFLNPPISTASIDFKLSETYLDTYAFNSPQKPKDSLTYTVSMQTIQDEDSKNPNLFQNLPSVLELEHMECRESMRPEIDVKECNIVSLDRIGSEKNEEELNNEELFLKIYPSILRLVECKDEVPIEKNFIVDEKINFEESKVHFGKEKFLKQKNTKNEKLKENQKENFAPKTQKHKKERSISKYEEKYGSSRSKENHNFSMMDKILKVKGLSDLCKDSYEYKNEIEKRNSLMKTSSSSYVNSPDFHKKSQNKKPIKCKSLRLRSPQRDINEKFGFKGDALRKKEKDIPSKYRKRILSDNSTVDKDCQIETTKNRSRYGSVHDRSAKLNNNAHNRKIDYLSILAVKMNLSSRQNTKRGKEFSEEKVNEKEKNNVLDKPLKLNLENDRKNMICQNEEINIKRLIKIKFQEKQEKKNMSLYA